jgi:hypothetical protein
MDGVCPLSPPERPMIPFEVEVSGGPAGTTVRLNGEEVPRLRDVVIRHGVGDAPTLELHVLPGPGAIVGEAEVRFVIGGRVFVEEPAS